MTAVAGTESVRAVPTDVSQAEAVQHLKDAAYEAFGEVALLMNNAGISPGGGPWDHPEQWRRLLEVNLWGIINGVQIFTQAMIDQGTPAAIVNTGSKQGITCPPGNTAYNVSKAGVKVLTEGLAHSLRNTEGAQVTAHLLIPGSTFTGMTRGNHTTKPAGAWTPDQVVDMMLDSMARGDFYILCPDNEGHARGRQPAHAVGGAGHRPEPPAAVALASGVQRAVQGVPRTGIRRPSERKDPVRTGPHRVFFSRSSRQRRVRRPGVLPRRTVSMIASGSYIHRVSNPAMIAPRIGATQNSQSWLVYAPPANRAGPVLRAGLTEVFVTGIDTRWISVSARPIGIPAKPEAAPLDVVPMMMNRKKNVITASQTKQATIPYFPGLRSP